MTLFTRKLTTTTTKKPIMYSVSTFCKSCYLMYKANCNIIVFATRPLKHVRFENNYQKFFIMKYKFFSILKQLFLLCFHNQDQRNL